jgi:hypothetical protein
MSDRLSETWKSEIFTAGGQRKFIAPGTSPSTERLESV